MCPRAAHSAKASATHPTPPPQPLLAVTSPLIFVGADKAFPHATWAEGFAWTGKDWTLTSWVPRHIFGESVGEGIVENSLSFSA